MCRAAVGTRGDEGPKVALGRALHPTWLGLGEMQNSLPPPPQEGRRGQGALESFPPVCLPPSQHNGGVTEPEERGAAPPIHTPGSSFHAPRDFRGALWTKGGKAPFCIWPLLKLCPPPTPMPSNTFPLLNANGPVFRGTAHRWAGVRSRKRSVSPPHPAAQTAVGQPRLQDLPRGPAAALRR